MQFNLWFLWNYLIFPVIYGGVWNMESAFKSTSETDLAPIFFKGCRVLDLWTLSFNLRGLCVLKVIGGYWKI